MALKFNNSDVTKVTYNGSEVQRVVYNGTIVWEAVQFVSNARSGSGSFIIPAAKFSIKLVGGGASGSAPKTTMGSVQDSVAGGQSKVVIKDADTGTILNTYTAAGGSGTTSSTSGENSKYTTTGSGGGNGTKGCSGTVGIGGKGPGAGGGAGQQGGQGSYGLDFGTVGKGGKAGAYTTASPDYRSTPGVDRVLVEWTVGAPGVAGPNYCSVTNVVQPPFGAKPRHLGRSAGVGGNGLIDISWEF